MLLSGNTSFCLTIECSRSVHAIVLALSLEVSDFHILIEKRITFMDRVKRVIHCDRAYKMGLNGKNITVAVMDTGIAPHLDFDQRILHFEDFCQKKLAAYDDNGHGSGKYF